MTRKDFQLIEDAMARTKPKAGVRRQQWEQDVCSLAYSLASTNARFDKDRFIKACNEVEK